jgi:PAS domain S-box-containing protein
VFADAIGKYFEYGLGKTAYECVDDRFAAVYSDHDAAVFESRGSVTREELVPYPDGSERTQIATKFPLFGPDGEVSTIVGINTDITERKEAEEQIRELNAELEQRVVDRTAELRESEERFRIIAESANVALYITREADGKFLYANKAGAELVGVPLEEMTRRSSREFMDDSGYRPALLEELKKSPRVRNNEFKIKRADGSIGWCLDSVTKIKFRGEDVLLSVVHDVTDLKRADEALRREMSERKQAETALRESEARLNALLDNSPAAIYLRELGGNYLLANRQFNEWYEGTPEGALGKWPSELFSDDRLELIAELDRKIVDKRGAIEKLTDLQHVDGETRTIMSVKYPVFDDNGAVRSIGGIDTDVTELKRAEAHLRESEARLQLITDALPALISYVDREGRWVFANRAFERWFGLPPEELLGRPIEEVVGEAAYEVLGPYSERALAGEAVAFQTRVPYAHGGTRDVEAVYVPHFAEDGEVAGAFAMVTDVTARRRTEKELREAREELVGKEKLAILGQLTATVSHEIRNPPAVLRASMHIIADNQDNPSPILSRAIERGERNIARCDRIIADLLDFTRMRALRPVSTDLDSWLEELLREQPLPEEIVLRREMGAPGVIVDMDRDHFRRAVINIFENACQAMTEKADGEGGRDRTLTLRTRKLGERIEVAVSDTGPGIPGDELARVYEPLFSTKGFGTGLGLTVVKQIMEQHRGGVEIDSEPGRGTEVALWLPISNSGEGDGRQA